MSVLVVVAAFLAAGVEWVEALTIVLAVGMFKGWRSALLGTVGGVLALAVLTIGFGAAISTHIDIAAARTLVGVFLLLFGLKWLHKAILRSGGVKALHDEAKMFEETRQALATDASSQLSSVDRVGVTTAFGGVFLEGLEVVFIIIALGGLSNVPAALVGAGASLLAVVTAGVVLRHPLTRVPENTMKYAVGIMLTAFGTFFAGEGLGVHWWNSDLSLLPLIAVYGAGSLLAVYLLRHPDASQGFSISPLLAAGIRELIGLFVDDGALAITTVAVLFGVSVFIDHSSSQSGLAGIVLVIGILVALAIGLASGMRMSRDRAKADRALASLSATDPGGAQSAGIRDEKSLQEVS